MTSEILLPELGDFGLDESYPLNSATLWNYIRKNYESCRANSRCCVPIAVNVSEYISRISGGKNTYLPINSSGKKLLRSACLSSLSSMGLMR